MKILFVCTGNICRSPMAHMMLQRYSDDHGLGLEVASAGTRALNGQPMHVESRRALLELGYEPTEFASRLLTPAVAAECDLLLGMTREHRAVARQLAPVRWKRMFALREISTSSVTGGPRAKLAVDPTDASLDIRDPIGRSAAVFDEVANEINVSVQALAAWIESQEARSNGSHSSAK
jgi:protein-tyrosine phosphatase